MVSKIFCFHPYLGKISILTNIFQMGWNHQLTTGVFFNGNRTTTVSHHWPTPNFRDDPSPKLRMEAWRSKYHPHTIHGTGIFTYIWLIFMVNVGKYTYHTWILWDLNTFRFEGYYTPLAHHPTFGDWILRKACHFWERSSIDHLFVFVEWLGEQWIKKIWLFRL